MVDIDARSAREDARDATDDRPWRGYAMVLATFGALAAAVAGVARLTGRRLPERPSAADVGLLTVSTFKLSRLLTKDAVTSPLRAPVARFERPAGAAELIESPRGHGLQHAVGEMLTCPFCTSVWIGGGLSAGLLFAPRVTRFAMATA